MTNTDFHEDRTHTSSFKPFNLYRQRMPEHFAYTPLHWHTEFEISFIISGCADYIIGDNKFTSSEGDIIISAPNVLHSVYPHDGQEQVYDTFLFSQDMLGASAGDRLSMEFILPIVSGDLCVDPQITKDHIYYSELRMAMENIISAAIGDNAKLDLLIKSELQRIFWLLDEAGDITGKNSKKPMMSEAIRPAIEYMNLHFADDISIKILAKEAGLSESYFMQKFREAAGISAIEYLNQIRIKAICGQLISTKKSAAEIAFDCGFRNISNFNRTFKRVTGVTPKEYSKGGGNTR